MGRKKVIGFFTPAKKKELLKRRTLKERRKRAKGEEEAEGKLREAIKEAGRAGKVYGHFF